MALPYYLAHEIPRAQLATTSESLLSRLHVETRFGCDATAVDTTARTVRLSNNETIPFDNLLIATGSSAIRPPVPGADGKKVFNLWTLKDATDVLAQVKSRPSAVLVGAGFIGMIILNALHKLGWRLSVVELEGHVLPRMLDRRGAECVERWLRDRGVGVYTGCSVQAIDSARTRKRLLLSDGLALSAQMVILSTGIRPNLRFLEGSGIEIERGILVNQHLESNVPGIYAAGDVAQGPDLLGGPRAIHAIQPTSVDHGRVAGANMAGRKIAYPGSLVMNILDVAKLHCASFGRWHEDGDTTVMFNANRPVYRKIVWEGDRIVGGIMLGPSEETTMLTDVGMLKGLIQARVDLGKWKGYLQERPWDLRRAYVASRAAGQLLQQKLTGAPTEPRGFHFNDIGPRTTPSEHHALLVGTTPDNFASLPRTPTPGIYKHPAEAKK